MPSSYREVRAMLDDPASAPQPPENVIELAAEIDQSLSREIRADVRAWALWCVFLDALDEVMEVESLTPEQDAYAASALFSLQRPIQSAALVSARKQTDDVLGE